MLLWLMNLDLGGSDPDVPPIVTADHGVVSQGSGVTLGANMTHMNGVGFTNVSTPLVPENET